MATKAYECRSGFSLPRSAPVTTQRGSERVFGAGNVYIIKPSDLKQQIALGWLVEVGSDMPEVTTAVPGEKRAVDIASHKAGLKKPGPDERTKREAGAAKDNAAAEEAVLEAKKERAEAAAPPKKKGAKK